MRSVSTKSAILSQLSEYLHDESRFQGGIPDTIFFPECIGDVQDIISRASSLQIPITFIGSRTGTTGGATCIDGCFAIAFSSMNKIISLEYTSDGSIMLVCEPGVTLSTIQSFLNDSSSYPLSVPGSEILKNNCLFYPPDPTEVTAQLGGTIAVNASGARSYRFGSTRSHVYYISLVNGGGSLISLLRSQYKMGSDGFNLQTSDGLQLKVPGLNYKNPSTKNAAGYYCKPDMDCIDLFIGSEGTLGAFVKIGIILQSRKDIISGLSFFPSRQAAFDFTEYLRSEQSIISIEYFDSSALNFINLHRMSFPNWLPEFPKNSSTAILWEWSENDPDKFESKMELFELNLCRCESSLEDTWSGFNTKEQSNLKRFRHALPEIINMIITQNKLLCPEIRKIGTDTAVPAEHFNDVLSQSISLIEKNNIPYAIFGHIGDYHLHINLLPDSEAQLYKSFEIYDKLMDLAISYGGTVSAEHGIGKIKRKYLKKMYSPEAINQMIEVKKAFDPFGIFNPGNML